MFRAVVVAGALAKVGFAADYDPVLAARLVNYCGAAYCGGSQKLEDWTCQACQNVPGLTEISQVFGPEHHGRAFVGYDHDLKARIVSFMGTNTEISTWIDDIHLVPSPCYTDVCPGCTCHPGFKQTYDEIASGVYSMVTKLTPGKLIITGHSLGAAQATHCAYDLHTRGLTADHIYTVGQPRIGNAAFAAFYDGLKLDHWRITHHRDPIPHLPWRGVGAYRHMLREAYHESASAGPATRVCSAVNPEDPLCTDQFNDELTIFHVSDHWYYLGFDFVKNMADCEFAAKANSSVMLV